MSRRITFNDINSLPDVMDASAFTLNLGLIPSGSSRHLTIKCQSASRPGFSNERITATVHGHSLNWRGRKTYPQTLSVQYLETSDMRSHNALQQWMEFCAGSESGNSQSYKALYSVLGELIMFDTTGAVADRVRLENVFPQDVTDTALSGESSAAMQVSATFSFDRFSSIGVPLF